MRHPLLVREHRQSRKERGLTSTRGQEWTDEQIASALQAFKRDDPGLHELTIICSPDRNAMIFTLVSQGYLKRKHLSDK